MTQEQALKLYQDLLETKGENVTECMSEVDVKLLTEILEILAPILLELISYLLKRVR